MRWRAILTGIILVLALPACGQPAEILAPTPEIAPTIASTDTPLPPNTPTPTPMPAFEPVFEPSACPFAVPADVEEGEDVVCGYVIVPEDHTQPAGSTIRLAVAVVKDHSDDHQPDPLLVLHGGPGGGIMQRAPSMAPLLQAFLGSRDMILFDQRGVGLSDPALECPEWHQNYLDTLDEANIDLRARTSYEAFMACRDRLIDEGVNLAAYNTTQSAADVQAIRLALGYDEINLYGGSYGSLLAQVVLREHPEMIRSVLLDSVLPVEKSLFVEGSVTVAADIQRLLDACKSDSECEAANPDLDQMLYDVIDRLDAEPAQITVRNLLDGSEYEMALTGEAVLGNLGGWLYQTSVIPLLPKTIHDLYNGDYQLMQQLTSINLTTISLITRGVMVSVMCQDDLTGRTFEDLLRVRESLPPALASNVSEDVLLEYGIFSLCAAWPVEVGEPAFKEPVSSNVPALILSGEFDPVTPPNYGRLVAAHLPNSYHYELPGVGHGPLVATECSTQMAAAFLNDPTTEPDSSCLADLGLEFVFTTELAQLDLESVTVEGFGIRSVVPAGWPRVDDEYWISPDQAIELVIKEEIGTDEEALLDRWGSTGEWRDVEANGRQWRVYDVVDRDDLGRYHGYIGTSPGDEGFYMVLMIGATEKPLSDMYEFVVAPIIGAFELVDATTSDATPADVEEGTTLEPFTDESLGITGMAPAGWTLAGPGTHTRGAPPQDMAVLIQKSYDGLTRDDLLARLLPSLGISELPEMAGAYQTDAFDWELYVVSVEAPGVGTIKVDVALAVKDMPYLILLQMLEDEYEALHEAVFLPALDALAPLG